MAHVACGRRTFFAVEAVFFEHLGQLHVLFADFETFLAVVGEILNVVTFSAGHAQLAGDGYHLFTNFFFLFNELGNRFRGCNRSNEAESQKESENQMIALHKNSMS